MQPCTGGIDNRTNNSLLETKHALFILLETDKYRILLDIRASDVFIRKAKHCSTPVIVQVISILLCIHHIRTANWIDVFKLLTVSYINYIARDLLLNKFKV